MKERYVPADIKRLVRKNSFYCCVICGHPIYTYEHVDPTFAEMKNLGKIKHEPKNMCLLCNNCNLDSAHGRLSKSTIRKAMEEPFGRFNKTGFHSLDLGKKEHPTVKLGNNRFEFQKDILKIEDKTIISIKPPSETDQPFRLSAYFYNKHATKIAEIVDNEWVAYTNDIWDLKLKGPKFTINQAKREISLVITLLPPNTLEINRLGMKYKKNSISIGTNGDTLMNTDSNKDLYMANNIFRRSKPIYIEKDGGVNI